MVLNMDVKSNNPYVNEVLKRPYFKEILYFFSKEHSKQLKQLIRYAKEKKPVNRSLLIDLNNQLVLEQAQRKQLVEVCKTYFGDSFMKNVKELEEYMEKQQTSKKSKIDIKLTHFKEPKKEITKEDVEEKTSKESQELVEGLDLQKLSKEEQKEIEKIVDRYMNHFKRLTEIVKKQNLYISEKETEWTQRFEFLEQKNALLEELVERFKKLKNVSSKTSVERKVKTSSKIKRIQNETEYSLMMLQIPLFAKEDVTAPRESFLEWRKNRLHEEFKIPSNKELVVVSHTAELYRDILINESPHVKPVALFYKEGNSHWVQRNVQDENMWELQSFLMERILDDSNLTFSDFRKLDEQQEEGRRLIVPFDEGTLWFGMPIRTAKNYNELIQYILWFQQTVRMVGSAQPFYFTGYFI